MKQDKSRETAPANKENPDQVFSAILEKAQMRARKVAGDKVPRIYIGLATCGLASGALETRKAFEEALIHRNMQAHIVPVGCMGHCYGEPLVIVDNPGFPRILYHQITPGKARMLVKSFLEEGNPLFEYLLGALEENDLIPQVWNFPRFNQEKRVVTEMCGLIDPEEIFDYIAMGGYSSLLEALGSKPEEIVDSYINRLQFTTIF